MDKQNGLLELEEINYTRKYQLLSKGNKAMLLFFNYCGCIIDANQFANDELKDKNGLIGTKIEDVFQELFLTSSDFIEGFQSARSESFKTNAYRKDNTCFPVSLHMRIEGNGNDLIGLCIVINSSNPQETNKDLSNAINEVEAAIKLKNEFAANITHELRTPVSGIMGLTKNLLKTDLSTSQMETVSIINRCCNNMNVIINDLLDFSKIGAGKLTMERKEFDFKQFIHNAVDLNINQINQKGLKLIVNVSNDIPNQLIGDEFRLTQILNNLISNAVKFTSVGHIAIEVAKTMNLTNEIELFFMVIDTGIGIEEFNVDKLFQSYTQVDDSITRRFGGTGLGLSICKKLLELMGGSIYVNSEKGKGSIFSFFVKLGIVGQTESQESFNISNGTFIYQEKEIKRDLNSKISLLAELEKPSDTKGKIHDIMLLVEKLGICIEMGNWEKAENFAIAIKNHLGKDDQEHRKTAFRLELTVRKEDHDKSLQLLSQLKEMLNEVE